MLENRAGSLPMAENLLTRLKLFRQLERERWLVNRYDVSITISQPDRQRLLDISGISRERISVVANGVGVDFFHQRSRSTKTPRTIVFWGNLSFPPNWTAIKYFYDEVFLPFLADKDISWYIVGRGANSEVHRIGKHPNIHLAGFQEDLVDFVSDKCVTINPMVEGSGLKNKVIESFTMGIPVVTTSLGVDAIEGDANVHYSVADTPVEFAAAILSIFDDPAAAQEMAERARDLVDNRYCWSAVGEKFQSVVSDLLSSSINTEMQQ